MGFLHNKRRLVTYHHFKSTGVGGLEALIRHIQRALGNKFELVELCHQNPACEVAENLEHVNYIVSRGGPRRNSLDKVLEMTRAKKILKKMSLCETDVLMLFEIKSFLSVPMATLNRVRIVFVQANSFEKLFRTSWSRMLFDFFVRYVNTLTVYTDKDKVEFLSYYPEFRGNIYVVPRGCKLSSLVYKPRCNLRRLVTIARVAENQKNFSFMIRVLDLLPSAYTLDIYGDGASHEIAALKQLVSSSKNKNVEFKGPTSDVAGVLLNYSVFLMTSNYEGFGQTLIEARSQGLPIIARDTFPALSFIVKDGVNGFRVSGAEKEFSEKVLQVTSSEESYHRLSKGAIELAGSTSESIVGDLWVGVLDQA